jgi:hypothetical protein
MEADHATLREFYRVLFPQKFLYRSIDEQQVDLDLWLRRVQ